MQALRILLVDDEARILRALKALLREHQVLTTSHAQSATELARRYDVDVVICDQRMPVMEGVDVLREMRTVHPRAVRMLLTGYSDLKAVLGSVNEGEVWRFINKPWDNAELRALVQEAGELAREAPIVASEPLSEAEAEQARHQVGILVIEDDPDVQQRLREILQPHYQVRFANTPDRALAILEQHETGVVVSETALSNGDLTGLLKTLKQFHPQIATVVITERANAQLAIDLINEGQVYRMLLKPVRLGSCRLSIDSAIGRYWQLKQNPQAIRRYSVASIPSAVAHPRVHVSASLLTRIRSLPARFFGVRAHA